MKAIVKRKPAQTSDDIIINGRRFTLAINIGPRNDVAKFRHPAPKFAHSAFCFDRPAF